MCRNPTIDVFFPCLKTKVFRQSQPKIRPGGLAFHVHVFALWRGIGDHDVRIADRAAGGGGSVVLGVQDNREGGVEVTDLHKNSEIYEISLLNPMELWDAWTPLDGPMTLSRTSSLILQTCGAAHTSLFGWNIPGASLRVTDTIEGRKV